MGWERGSRGRLGGIDCRACIRLRAPLQRWTGTVQAPYGCMLLSRVPRFWPPPAAPPPSLDEFLFFSALSTHRVSPFGRRLALCAWDSAAIHSRRRHPALRERELLPKRSNKEAMTNRAERNTVCPVSESTAPVQPSPDAPFSRLLNRQKDQRSAGPLVRPLGRRMTSHRGQFPELAGHPKANFQPFCCCFCCRQQN